MKTRTIELRTVQLWHEALNERDKMRMASLVTANIKVGGPRGDLEGVSIMLDWVDRAQVSLTPKRYFSSGNTIAVEQLAEWHDAVTGDLVDAQTVASVFVVENAQIKSIHRHDDLRSAFEITELSEGDEVKIMRDAILIRNARPGEYAEIGRLMVDVYSQLEGFPKETEQPNYYKMLLNVGGLASKPDTEIIVAVAEEDQILGAVVNFSDMQHYGSGGTATAEKNSGGFRLLAVHTNARGMGIGRLLTSECIQRAKRKNLRQVIIHTTRAMMTAWRMYESIGFKRSEDLDFMQGDLAVFGFRLPLEN